MRRVGVRGHLENKAVTAAANIYVSGQMDPRPPLPIQPLCITALLCWPRPPVCSATSGTVTRFSGGPEFCKWPLPFVVLAVEQPVEDLAQGADMMQVVQDDDKGHVYRVVLAVALVGKVGQILAQFLRRPEGPGTTSG